MKRRILIYAILTSVLFTTLVVTGISLAAAPVKKEVNFYLTILHNNDGESQVVDAGSGLEDFGGVARFKAVVDRLKWEAICVPQIKPGANQGVLIISSGDSFIAGPEFNASLVNGVPFYDTIAMELIGYDAVNFGNHDFDFGPDVLADFLAGYVAPPPYIAANMDFSGEPRLQASVDAGVIVPATIIKEHGQRIGVIGIETPNLPSISSPRNVVVSDDLVNIVQGQVDMLEAQGVNKIILASHLQSIENEKTLVALLDGVDVVIAGGGTELLANPDDLLVPGDEIFLYGSYPQMVSDADGTMVPVVTTFGEYHYVGKLVVGFNKDGEVIKIDEDLSGPVRVATGDCNGYTPCEDAVNPDPTIQAMVVDPVEAYLASLGSIVIGTSEVDLDGLRTSVRSIETNEGNLLADSLKWQGAQMAAAYGVPAPDVALQNGGGIRNDSIIPAGDITELDTFDIAPFPNFVTIVPDIPRDQFKEILENAVSRTEFTDGRFAQISGFSFQWSASGTAQILDMDGEVVTPGTRVKEVTLDDGTSIVTSGVVQTGDPVNIATLDFLAKGGDQYPFRGAPFTIVGVTYQQALSNSIQMGIGGNITAADYPEDGEGRIIPLP